ncbi:serine protease [Candidatus Woesearchaeota archaeon]|nr:serine protease [Candidatus Woesearchaeota archaeon]
MNEYSELQRLVECKHDIVSSRRITNLQNCLLRFSYMVDGEMSGGMGFLLDKGGYFVTNNHVLGNVKESRVIFNNDENNKSPITLCKSSICDLLLGKCDVPDEIKENFPKLYLNKDKVGPGEQIFAYFLSDDGFTLDKGIIKCRDINEEYSEKIRKKKVLKTSYSSDLKKGKPGCSGSPVFRKKTGELLGVTWGEGVATKYLFSFNEEDFERRHYFVRIEYVKQMLNHYLENVKKEEPKKKPFFNISNIFFKR